MQSWEVHGTKTNHPWTDDVARNISQNTLGVMIRRIREGTRNSRKQQEQELLNNDKERLINKHRDALLKSAQILCKLFSNKRHASDL